MQERLGPASAATATTTAASAATTTSATAATTAIAGIGAVASVPAMAAFVTVGLGSTEGAKADNDDENAANEENDTQQNHRCS